MADLDALLTTPHRQGVRSGLVHQSEWEDGLAHHRMSYIHRMSREALFLQAGYEACQLGIDGRDGIRPNAPLTQFMDGIVEVLNDRPCADCLEGGVESFWALILNAWREDHDG